ncbi:ankyrin repeat domain-containing protein [Alcanivorax hongdengensis]|uniref:ankyrin repeat domain-containing protein n=1 Tax=Alcanivorax hongdengensis TaxID=519051 RepID=UPI0012FB6938|nr:hypothetical protein [Alcanivorax hongdengensis]
MNTLTSAVFWFLTFLYPGPGCGEVYAQAERAGSDLSEYSYEMHSSCEGFSPLWIAARDNNRRVSDKLMKAGWPVHEKKIGRESPVIIWRFYTNGWLDLIPKDFNPRKKYEGDSMLLFACQEGGYEDVKKLLGIIPVNEIDNEGMNCLSRFLRGVSYHEKSMNLLQLLVSEGVSLNQVEKLGETPLGRSVLAYIDTKKNGDKKRSDFLWKVIVTLLNAGASPNISSGVYLPLTEALLSKDYDLANLLLNHGADPNRLSCDGYSCIGHVSQIPGLDMNKLHLD